jgi:hypothetical protein
MAELMKNPSKVILLQVRIILRLVCHYYSCVIHVSMSREACLTHLFTCNLPYLHTYMYILLNCRTTAVVNVRALQCYTVKASCRCCLCNALYTTVPVFYLEGRACLRISPQVVPPPKIFETQVYNNEEEGKGRNVNCPCEKLNFNIFLQYFHHWG